MEDPGDPPVRRKAPLLAGLLAGLLLVQAWGRGVPAGAEDAVRPDYEFFKRRLWPQLEALCAECHADARRRARMGRFFLRPVPGRTVRERHLEDNFEEVLRFVEPGNPAASALLLKALGPDRGGVEHEGGAVVGENDVAYGALVDFINGVALPPPTFRPPPSPEGQPDFLYYLKHVAPVTHRVCAECHAMPGKGRMKVIVPGPDGGSLTLEEHYTNYQAILRLTSPRDPLKSRFLVKPLAVADGGFQHKGGDRIRKDDVNYLRWVEFLTGVRGPPLPSGARPAPRALTAQGLALEAEDLRAEGDLARVDLKEARGYLAVTAGSEGGELDAQVDVEDAGTYRVAVRAAAGLEGLTLTIGDGAPTPLGPLDPAPGPGGLVRYGPQTLLDGAEPLAGVSGVLALEGETLRMDGRAGGAAWLSPAQVRHRGVSARVRLPDEEDGGDDAWLLFDMRDADNGKFLGWIDGGRRLVLGVIEGGAPRVLAAERAPEPRERIGEAPDDGFRELKVEYYAGVVVGSLDGRPVLHMNLDEHLGEGLFGVRTHGALAVGRVSALEEYEVYAVTWRLGATLPLAAGLQRLVLALPPGAGPVDWIEFAPP